MRTFSVRCPLLTIQGKGLPPQRQQRNELATFGAPGRSCALALPAASGMPA